MTSYASLLDDIRVAVGFWEPIEPLLAEIQERSVEHAFRESITTLLDGVARLAPCIDAVPAATAAFEGLLKALEAIDCNEPAAVRAALNTANAALGSEPSLTIPALLPPEPDALAWLVQAKAVGGQALADFLPEARELLEVVEQKLLEIEASPSDRGTLDALFRALHTVKGSAGFLQLRPVVQCAHAFETCVDRARKGEFAATPSFAEICLVGVDRLRSLLAWVEPLCRNADPSGDLPEFEELSRAFLAFEPEDAPFGSETNAQASIDSVPGPATPSLPPEARARGPAKAPVSLVKVDAAKLDELIETVGELALLRNMLVATPALRAARNPQLERLLTDLEKTAKRLQSTSLGLRMVPVGPLFDKMSRIVRDTAKKLGKKVSLELGGKDTELDRSIVDSLHDPLMHMVRNAVDHGLEMPEDRVAAGKKDAGTVRLSARHESGEVVIEIADNGKGLDPERLIAKAIEKGIVEPGAKIGPDEALRLIFAAGFSTAAAVTDISGRGVGMDVVRTEIEKLRGKVEIASAVGQGTTFRIRLPLTLAIIDGMAVRVGDRKYLLPAHRVDEAVGSTSLDHASAWGTGAFLTLRSQVMPLTRLHDLVQSGECATDTRSVCLIVQTNSGRQGILVDEVLGRQEIVLRPLGPAFRGVRLFSGGSVLSDGTIGLVLDVDEVTAPSHRRNNVSAGDESFAP